MVSRFAWVGAFALLSISAAAVESVSRLAANLEVPDKEIRREASYHLDQLGPAAKQALPALIKALADPDKQVWSNSISAIAKIGPEATEAIPTLLAALDNRTARGNRDREKKQSRFRAAYALSCIGAAAIPQLTAALSADDPGLRTGAIMALGGMGAAGAVAIPELRKNLGHDDPELRRELAEAFAKIGPAAVQPLKEALTQSQPRERETAAASLAELGRTAASAAPALLELFPKEQDPSVRIALLTALGKTGADPVKVAPFLVAALRDENEALRPAAVNALLIVRPVQAAALPGVIALLKEKPEVSQRAAYVLGRMGAAATNAVPELIRLAGQPGAAAQPFIESLSQIGAPAVPAVLQSLEAEPPEKLAAGHWSFQCFKGMGGEAVAGLRNALTSGKAPVRLAAARGLADIGLEASSAGPALLEISNEPEATVRAALLRAMVAVGAETKRTLDRLNTSLADPSPLVRAAALECLPADRTVLRAFVPKITAALADGEPQVRLAALRALGAAGPRNLPMIIEKLDDPALRNAAVGVLAQLKHDAGPAVPRLQELLAGAPEELRLQIIKTLGEIGHAAQPALPALTTGLHDGAEPIRIAAVKSFSQVEPDAAKQLPVLTKALEDQSPKVRAAAAEALGRNGEKARDATPQLVALLHRGEDREMALAALEQVQVSSVPHLLEALAMPDQSARIYACNRLASLGGAAREALDALKKQQESGDSEDLRRAARRAVRAIEQGKR